jgi:hypothetical protein
MLRVVVVGKVCLVEERFRTKEDRKVFWQRRGAINMGRMRDGRGGVITETETSVRQAWSDDD